MEDHALSTQGELARMETQRMFRHMLEGWAWDILNLRRNGLDLPTYRQPDDGEEYSWRKAA